MIRAFGIKTDSDLFPRTILIVLLLIYGKNFTFVTVKFALLAPKMKNGTERDCTGRYGTGQNGTGQNGTGRYGTVR